MDNVENKYENNNFDDIHKKYDFQKEPSNDTTDQINSHNEGIGKRIENWMDAHPIETISIVSIGTTIIAYKLYKHLLTSAIFEANKKTIEFMSYDPDIAF